MLVALSINFNNGVRFLMNLLSELHSESCIARFWSWKRETT